MGNESYPEDSVLEGLSEAIGAIGTPPRTTGQSPHVVNIQKLRDWLDRVLKVINGCRFYHHPADDGALDFSVYPGYAGSPHIYYAGSTNNLLTNNATNYIYLALATGAAVLTINQSGYPQWPTPHFRIGRITTAAGSYTIDATDMVDDRDQNLWTHMAGGNLLGLDWQESVLDELDFTAAEPGAPSVGDRYINTGSGASSGTAQTVAANDIEQWNGTDWTEITPTEGAMLLVEDRNMLVLFDGSSWIDIGTAALMNEAQAFFAATDITGGQAETLTDTSNADTLHVHAAGGVPTLQDCIPNLLLTGQDDGDGTGECSVQVRDAANNNLAERFLVRTWIADAEWSEPDPQTGFSVSTGELMRQLEANADLEIITNANGLTEVNIDTGGAKTVYVMAEIDGRIYSSGAINITVP